MKRLVTQFDDVRTRATVATPTCCCCCCCCVASTLTASTVTAITAYQGAADARHEAATAVPPTRRPGPPWLYAIAGFLALPLAFVTGGVTVETLGIGVVLIVVGVLAGLVALIYRLARVQLAAPKMLIPVGIVVFGFPLEVGIAGQLLFLGEGAVVAYLALAVIVAAGVGALMIKFRRRRA